VLPPGARLRRREEFLSALRTGRRSTGGRPTLVVTHLSTSAEVSAAGDTARVGFVVSRAVGPAVVRNRVRRRLRHLVAERLASVPARARLVVRALPAAADASYAELGAALDAAMTRSLAR
jgi:ribonuclease P protein component